VGEPKREAARLELIWADHADRAGEPKDGKYEHSVSEGKHDEVGKHGTPFHMNRAGGKTVERRAKGRAKDMSRRRLSLQVTECKELVIRVRRPTCFGSAASCDPTDFALVLGLTPVDFRRRQ